ncbi:hypothetical protein BDR06DRAFT_237693 [Suillus hirtellus]|nr:hypothetical protein BDR06DRAFT_237693 [Suillus hirtellus]
MSPRHVLTSCLLLLVVVLLTIVETLTEHIAKCHDLFLGTLSWSLPRRSSRLINRMFIYWWLSRRRYDSTKMKTQVQHHRSWRLGAYQKRTITVGQMPSRSSGAPCSNLRFERLKRLRLQGMQISFSSMKLLSFKLTMNHTRRYCSRIIR